MKNLGKIHISEDFLADTLMVTKANLYNIWKENERDRNVWCVLESPIFDSLEEGKEVPNYELEITADRVGNKIVEAKKYE